MTENGWVGMFLKFTGFISQLGKTPQQTSGKGRGPSNPTWMVIDPTVKWTDQLVTAPGATPDTSAHILTG